MKRKKDHFLGYIRPDGQVGVRNYLLMLSGTLYANTICERIAQMMPDTIPILHPLGRCQVMPDLRMTFKCLVGHGKNPNAGAVIVVDHFKEEGCTADEIAHEIAKTKKPVAVVNIQRANGAINATRDCMKHGLDFLRRISDMRREEAHVKHLIFGVNCGTSDTTSGLSSNLAVGECVDLIVSKGGRAIQAETTEMIGGEEFVLSKCINRKVASKLLGFIQQREQGALDAGCDVRGSQPTGDNIVGGLSSIEEKSLGAIKKGGKSKIVDVVGHNDPIGKKPGLYIMDSPGHGGESITGIASAGCQILAFSTGGCHTINHPLMITIRLSGNRNSIRRMEDTTEVDVSDMFEGTSVAEAGRRLYEEVLDTSSGKMTKAEILKEYNAFAIHRIGPSV